MYILEIFGRIFISSLFLVEGIRKFLNPDISMMYISDHGLPEFLLYPSIAFEIVFPLLLIVGYKTKISASLLALFVLTVTFIFHSHHIFDNGMQLTIFFKNFAILGGLLVIIANKPQVFSIDYYLKTKKGN